MRVFQRAALGAASLLCLAGTMAVATPSFATQAPGSGLSATTMLATVTAPLLAVDVRSLQSRETRDDQDFSTTRRDEGSSIADDGDATAPATLSQMVSEHSAGSVGDEQGDCLATSVYYESKGEPLEGQLAVAQTVLNRAASGRFPNSVCGVVLQPGQFSFVHGGDLPQPSHDSRAWQRAVAIATIARDGLWKQMAPDALFFHARRVSPGWGKIKVALLGHHIFFR